MYWIAIFMMLGGPPGSPDIHSLSGPPQTSKEACEQNARTAGLDVFQRFHAPRGWMLDGAFCIPIDDKFQFNPYTQPA